MNWSKIIAVTRSVRSTRCTWLMRFTCCMRLQTKSKSGIATPQPDMDLVEWRLKVVLARYGLGGR